MTNEELQTIIKIMRVAMEKVIASYDKADKEEFDECSWQEFQDSGGIDPLSHALAQIGAMK